MGGQGLWGLGHTSRADGGKVSGSTKESTYHKALFCRFFSKT